MNIHPRQLLANLQILVLGQQIRKITGGVDCMKTCKSSTTGMVILPTRLAAFELYGGE